VRARRAGLAPGSEHADDGEPSHRGSIPGGPPSQGPAPAPDPGLRPDYDLRAKGGEAGVRAEET
jgi:hypothetical protein